MMWECRKCKKPVFFAERKQSLGFDWHPSCLRCEECGKRLNPGQHAEHKGVPYCHHPCYGALFGPQLFGHGTRNECHTSFGKVVNRDGQVKRSHLETSLKTYNQSYEGKPGELKSREANGQLILEGVLRIYWGVQNVIHLKEEDSARIVPQRPVSHIVDATMYNDSDDDDQPLWRDNSPSQLVRRRSSHGNTDQSNTSHFDFNTMRTPGRTDSSNGNSDTNLNHMCSTSPAPSGQASTEKATPNKTGNSALRRRPGRRMEKTKLKRRCSINGHFYLRETSSFTPPFGSACSLWVTSKTTAEEVLNMLLDKYKVEMAASNFALFVVKETGEQRRIKSSDSPLISRVLLGADEDVAKVFIMDAHKTQEISQEVAEFLNLSIAECRAILLKYEEEEKKLMNAIRAKYEPQRLHILRYMKEKENMQHN